MDSSTFCFPFSALEIQCKEQKVSSLQRLEKEKKRCFITVLHGVMYKTLSMAGSFMKKSLKTSCKSVNECFYTLVTRCNMGFFFLFLTELGFTCFQVWYLAK